MNENRRCSILFHFEVPGGKWQTSISSSVSSASFCSSIFHSLGPVAVRTAAVGGDRQPRNVRIALRAEVLPPAADRVDRELGGVVIDPDVDVPLIELEVIHAVGDCLAELLVLEVMDADPLRLPFEAPFAPWVLEIADQLLLLGIHADHRPPRRDRRRGGLIDVRKLRVTIGMRSPFLGLHVGLQRVAQQPHERRDGSEVHVVTHLTQRAGDLPHALRRPAQQRLRIPTRVRIDQPLDVIEDRRVALQQRPATTTPATDAAGIKPLTRLQLGDPLTDRVNRHPGRARRRRNPTPARSTRLARSPQPALTLIQLRRHRPEPFTDRELIDHTSKFYAPSAEPAGLFIYAP